MSTTGTTSTIIDQILGGTSVLCVGGRLAGRTLEDVLEWLSLELPPDAATAARGAIGTRPLAAGGELVRRLGGRFPAAFANAAARPTETDDARAVLEILATLPFRAILTTSFAELIPSAFPRARAVTVPCVADRAGGAPPLASLFGSTADLERVIVTPDALRSALVDDRFAAVRTLFSRYPFFFVGYAPGDGELALLLDRILSGVRTEVEHHALVPGADPVFAAELERGWRIRALDRDLVDLARDLGAAATTPRSPRPADDDLEAWVTLARDEDLRPVAEWRLDTLERELIAAGDHARLVELYLARLDDEPSMLERLAETLEHGLGDPSRALTARLAAYRAAPRLEAWPTLERLAAASGCWAELRAELADSLAEVARDQRAEGWLRLARVDEQELADPDEAVTDCEAALALEPGWAEAHERLLGILERASRWPALAAALEDRIAAEPAAFLRARMIVRLGVLYEVMHDDPSHAIACYRRALDADLTASTEDALESLLRRRGEPAALAGFLAERAERAEPEAARKLRIESATLRAELGDRSTAIALLERLRTDLADLAVLRALAALYEADGALRPAADCLTEVAGLLDDRRERARVNRELATRWRCLGELGRAADCLEWALVGDDRCEAVHRELAALYRADGRWLAAIDVVKRHARFAAREIRGGLFLEIAALYEHEVRDAERAVEFYERAEIELDDPIPALRALARLQEPRERYTETVRALTGLADRLDGPERRAVLARAGELTLGRLADPRSAEALFERALSIVPDDVPTRLRLAAIMRIRDKPGRAAVVLREGLELGATGALRAGLLAAAAAAEEACGDLAAAQVLLLEGLELEPELAAAVERIADLRIAAGDTSAAISALRQVAALPAAPPLVRTQRLVAVGRAARIVGDHATAERAFAAALELTPDQPEAERGRAEALHELQRWADAAEALARLLGRDDVLAAADRAELHALAGDALCQQRQFAAAEPHIAAALALVPDHPRARESHAEVLLERGDRAAVAAPADALAAYRAALEVRPDDHLLLLRCADLLVAGRSWDDALSVIDRLIATEDDLELRARYRDVAATILGDELGHDDAARVMLAAALADSASPERAASLEAALAASGDTAALEAHLRGRLIDLGAPGDDDGLGTERLRLWSRLASLCLEVGRSDDAMTALEVEVHLDPASPRRRRLAELLVAAGPDAIDKAIAHHHELVRREPGEIASYRALESLYRRASRDLEADACRDSGDALLAVGLGEAAVAAIAEPRRPWSPPSRVLSAEAWSRICHPAEDPALSTLLATALPSVATWTSRLLASPALAARDAIDPAAAHPFTRVLRAVAGALGTSLPEVHARPDQTTPVRFAVRRDRRALVPAFLLGRPIVSEARADATLAFHLGRALTCLRPERLAALLVADPRRMAVMVADITDGGVAVATSGNRRVARAIEPEAAARSWLCGADATASRAGLLVSGDLARCVAALFADAESEMVHSRRERLLDLIAWNASPERFDLQRSLAAIPIDRDSARSDAWPTAASLAG